MIVFASAIGPAAPAVAQEEAEPIRLVYRASEACPDEGSFVARIRARTARARLAWAGEAARTFTVVTEAGPPPSGHVIVTGGDRPEGTRWVQGDTCSDVVDALALVVALAIDPRASSPAEARPLTAASMPASSAPPSLALPDSPPDVPSASPAPRAPVRTSRADDTAPEGSVSEPTLKSGAFSAGADFAVATGVAPNALLGAAPYVGWRAKSARVLDPSIRLAFMRAGSGNVVVPSGGSATFTWTVGRIDACPVAWPRGVLRTTACVRVEAGALEAAGADIVAARTRLRPWVAAGPVARAEWSFVWAVFLDAEIGALFRVTDDRFVFLPSTLVYEVPLVGVSVGLGLGAHFL